MLVYYMRSIMVQYLCIFYNMYNNVGKMMFQALRSIVLTYVEDVD